MRCLAQVFGHSHCYERYQPVFNLTVRGGLAPGDGGSGTGREAVYLDPHATVHVTSGGQCGGLAAAARPDLLLESLEQCFQLCRGQVGEGAACWQPAGSILAAC